ncbi:MAG: TlpA disulfide reductase family protein [Alphaproteobacteria bacterium]|nr:TlpA disulfide reductase family protein [Alphaproteobacteria bacterium]
MPAGNANWIPDKFSFAFPATRARTKRKFSGMTALGASAAILVGLAATPARADFADHMQMLDPPRQMPPLVFENAEGAQHTLADYHGHFILLNVWATWCGPCVRELPSLDQLQAKLGTRVIVLPLAEDRGDDTVAAYYKLHHLTHLPVAVDRGGIAPSALNLKGVPTTLLINPQGLEVARYQGDADWMSDDALAFINATTQP